MPTNMVGETLKSNIRERVNSVKQQIQDSKTTVRESAELLKNLRPLQASINLVQKSPYNKWAGLRRQLEITRRLIG